MLRQSPRNLKDLIYCNDDGRVSKNVWTGYAGDDWNQSPFLYTKPFVPKLSDDSEDSDLETAAVVDFPDSPVLSQDARRRSMFSEGSQFNDYNFSSLGGVGGAGDESFPSEPLFHVVFEPVELPTAWVDAFKTDNDTRCELVAEKSLYYKDMFTVLVMRAVTIIEQDTILIAHRNDCKGFFTQGLHEFPGRRGQAAIRPNFRQLFTHIAESHVSFDWTEAAPSSAAGAADAADAEDAEDADTDTAAGVIFAMRSKGRTDSSAPRPSYMIPTHVYVQFRRDAPDVYHFIGNLPALPMFAWGPPRDEPWNVQMFISHAEGRFRVEYIEQQQTCKGVVKTVY